MPLPAPVPSHGSAELRTAFRRCAGKFATGVVAVLSPGAGRPAGMTANSFTSVSLDPPVVLVSLSRKSRSLSAITRDGRFSVNVLGTRHTELAAQLAVPGAAFPDRAGFHWHRGHVLVPDALATLCCRVERLVPVGDHVLVLGAVDSLATGTGEHLLFLEGTLLGAGTGRGCGR